MQVECAEVVDLLEVFGGNCTFVTKMLVQVNQTGSKQTEEQAKTNNNGIADGFIERRLSSKEGFLATELEKGGGDIVLFE